MSVKVGSGIRLIREKLIVSGDILEVYQYSGGYYEGFKSEGGRNKVATGEQKRINRTQTIYRARNTIRRIINANIGQYGREFTAKFVTLTFKNHIADLKMAHCMFDKYTKRLNYRVYGSKRALLQYTAVPEFTKRGRVHYHVIYYNLPYLKASDLESLWGNGFVKINKIDHVDNVGAYICKYMAKDADDSRFHGNKLYFNSRGLFKPEEITDKKVVESVRDSLPVDKLRYSNTFENEHLGTVIYEQYNLTE